MKAAKLFLAVFFLCAHVVYFSACTNEPIDSELTFVDEEISLDLAKSEAYEREPYEIECLPQYTIDMGGWRRHNSVQPIAPASAGLGFLPVGNIVVVQYYGNTILAKNFIFAPDKDALTIHIPESFGRSIPYAMPIEYWPFSALALSNNIILFGYVPAELVPFLYAFKNLETGETRQVAGGSPVFLDNGLVAFFDNITPVTLYDLRTGRPADVQLDFDYGRRVEAELRLFSHITAYERFVFALGFDVQTNQYFMFYAEGGTEDGEDDFDVFGPFQGRIAVFDETGRQIDSMEIEHLTSARWNVVTGGGYRIGKVLFHEGRLFYSWTGWIDNLFEIDLAERVHVEPNNFPRAERERIRAEHRLPEEVAEALQSGPPLPVEIIYTLNHTFIYSKCEERTLLLTLDAEYLLSFYTFDENGEAVMLFSRWRKTEHHPEGFTFSDYLERMAERNQVTRIN